MAALLFFWWGPVFANGGECISRQAVVEKVKITTPDSYLYKIWDGEDAQKMIVGITNTGRVPPPGDKLLVFRRVHEERLILLVVMKGGCATVGKTVLTRHYLRVLRNTLGTGS